MAHPLARGGTAGGFSAFMRATPGTQAAGAVRGLLAGAGGTGAALHPGGEGDGRAVVASGHLGRPGRLGCPGVTPLLDEDASTVADPDDPLHPASRTARQLGPPPQVGPPPPASAPAPAAPAAFAPAAGDVRAHVSVEDLVPALVRKVAWSGDGRRGCVRLELGAGSLSGATLTVHADGGRVRVHLRVPPAEDADAWRERIAVRLAARGLSVDDVEVGR